MEVDRPSAAERPMVVDRWTPPSDTTSPLQWADQCHGELEDTLSSSKSTNGSETLKVNAKKEQFSREQVPDRDWPQGVPLNEEIDVTAVTEKSTAVAGMSAEESVDHRTKELAEESYNRDTLPEDSEQFCERIFETADMYKDDPDNPDHAVVPTAPFGDPEVSCMRMSCVGEETNGHDAMVPDFDTVSSQSLNKRQQKKQKEDDFGVDFQALEPIPYLSNGLADVGTLRCRFLLHADRSDRASLSASAKFLLSWGEVYLCELRLQKRDHEFTVDEASGLCSGKAVHLALYEVAQLIKDMRNQGGPLRVKRKRACSQHEFCMMASGAWSRVAHGAHLMRLKGIKIVRHGDDHILRRRDEWVVSPSKAKSYKYHNSRHGAPEKAKNDIRLLFHMYQRGYIDDDDVRNVCADMMFHSQWVSEHEKKAIASAYVMLLNPKEFGFDPLDKKDFMRWCRNTYLNYASTVFAEVIKGNTISTDNPHHKDSREWLTTEIKGLFERVLFNASDNLFHTRAAYMWRQQGSQVGVLRKDGVEVAYDWSKSRDDQGGIVIPRLVLPPNITGHAAVSWTSVHVFNTKLEECTVRFKRESPRNKVMLQCERLQDMHTSDGRLEAVFKKHGLKNPGQIAELTRCIDNEGKRVNEPISAVAFKVAVRPCKPADVTQAQWDAMRAKEDAAEPVDEAPEEEEEEAPDEAPDLVVDDDSLDAAVKKSEETSEEKSEKKGSKKKKRTQNRSSTRQASVCVDRARWCFKAQGYLHDNRPGSERNPWIDGVIHEDNFHYLTIGEDAVYRRPWLHQELATQPPVVTGRRATFARDLMEVAGVHETIALGSKAHTLDTYCLETLTQPALHPVRGEVTLRGFLSRHSNALSVESMVFQTVKQMPKDRTSIRMHSANLVDNFFSVLHLDSDGLEFKQMDVMSRLATLISSAARRSAYRADCQSAIDALNTLNEEFRLWREKRAEVTTFEIEWSGPAEKRIGTLTRLRNHELHEYFASETVVAALSKMVLLKQALDKDESTPSGFQLSDLDWDTKRVADRFSGALVRGHDNAERARDTKRDALPKALSDANLRRWKVTDCDNERSAAVDDSIKNAGKVFTQLYTSYTKRMETAGKKPLSEEEYKSMARNCDGSTPASRKRAFVEKLSSAFDAEKQRLETLPSDTDAMELALMTFRDQLGAFKLQPLDAPPAVGEKRTRNPIADEFEATEAKRQLTPAMAAMLHRLQRRGKHRRPELAALNYNGSCLAELYRETDPAGDRHKTTDDSNPGGEQEEDHDAPLGEFDELDVPSEHAQAELLDAEEEEQTPFEAGPADLGPVELDAADMQSIQTAMDEMSDLAPADRQATLNRMVLLRKEEVARSMARRCAEQQASLRQEEARKEAAQRTTGRRFRSKAICRAIGKEADSESDDE